MTWDPEAHITAPVHNPCEVFRVAFETLVDKRDRGKKCWMWRGRDNGGGVRMFSYGQQRISAARIAWALEQGDYPVGRLSQASCGNRACVNPEHRHETNNHVGGRPVLA